MSKGSKILSNLALVSQIGITIVVILVGFILLGRFLDTKLGTKYIFLIVFTIFGLLSSFNYILKIGTQGLGKERKKTTISYDREEIKKLSQQNKNLNKNKEDTNKKGNKQHRRK